jgi:hypothetical protein
MDALAPLDFIGLLEQADAVNRQLRFDRATAHLPGDLAGAIRTHRQQIKAFHAAVQANGLAAAGKISAEAHLMAVKLNHGEPGILASKDAPGYVLSRRCAAAAGKVPLFGQQGCFRIEVSGVPVRIEMDGMFGLGGPVPGFSAHVVDVTRPFISETGYRSFLAFYFALPTGLTTATFAAHAISLHIAGELRGKLLPIAARYRDRAST